MKKISFYIAGALLVLSSCKKDLVQNDPQSISEANAFTTIEHVQLGVNGAYGDYGTYVNDIYKTALTSDEIKIGNDNAGQGALTYRYQYSSDATTGGDVIAGYDGYYAMIDQVNRTLPYVYTVSGAVSTARRDELQGQLLALRAIAHFGLLQSFGGNYNPSGLGIAYVTTVNPLGRPARGTMLETMTGIEKDLNDAKALLPAVTPASFRDTVMNKVNVAAYQARIALYKGDYANAITYATEVITSNVKPLVSGSAFGQIWTDVDANSTNGIAETLFRIRFSNSSALGGIWTTTGNLNYLQPSDKIVSEYDADDIRLPAYIGGTDEKYVNKYYISSRGGRVVDMKCIRTPEMYLIRAEAQAKSSSPDLAAGSADVNTVRAARIPSYTPVTFGSAADLLSNTLDERYKELWLEGQRFFDLRRNNLPVQRTLTDATSSWVTLPADSYRFVYPIPNDAILANPNIQQNPGY